LSGNHHYRLEMNFRRSRRVIVLLLALLLGFTALNGKVVQAQETLNDWSAPVNISNSGGASNPVLLMDANKNLLAFWGDTFTGFNYSVLSDNGWSAPQPFPVPFGSPQEGLRYQVLDHRGGAVHMLWTDETHQLFYASMPFDSVNALGAWESTRLISKNVANFNGVVDEDGRVHIAYLLGQDTSALSAGIYYVKITADNKLTLPVVMDQSAYLRRGTNGSNMAAGTEPSLATLTVWNFGSGPSTTVLFSWNNPVTNRLFLRRSVDAGTNWEDAVEIVTPGEKSANQRPQRPSFALVENSILFLWQNSQEEATCTQYYQSSTDGGMTWSERQELLIELEGCPEQISVFSVADQGSFLASIYNDQVYLAAFKNSALEPSQLQDELSSFIDPMTYRNIRLQSQQVLLVDHRLYLIGSGVGDVSDIWVTSRLVDSLFNPQNARPVWSNPRIITQGQDPYRDIRLLANGSSQVHAIWSQPSGGSKDAPGVAIYYAGWSNPGEGTSRPVLRSPEGKSDQPSAVVDATGRMYVVWSGGKSGELFFSYSDITQASTQIDWSEPVSLGLASSLAAEPLIKIGADGVLYVAYLIPLNEQRGVYVARSLDRGETWSTPVQVFDAAAQHCEMVQSLSFVISTANTQHLAWICSTIPGGTGAYAFHYARSSDDGQNWALELDQDEQKIVWGMVGGLSQDNIHRVWMEASAGATRLYDRVSKDDGATWQPAQEMDSFEEAVGPSAMAIDPGGQVFLVVVVQEGGKAYLDSWTWNGTEWNAMDNKKLVSGQASLINSLAAVVLPRGELEVLYSLENTNESTGAAYYTLMDVSHAVEIFPAVAVSAQKTTPTAAQFTPVVTGGVTPVPAELTATPQPTLDLNALKETGGGNTSSVLIYVVGAILALVVVIFAVIVSQYKRVTK